MESGVFLPVLIVLNVDEGVELYPPHVGAVPLGPRHHQRQVGSILFQLERDDCLLWGAVQDDEDEGEGGQCYPVSWVLEVFKTG